MKVRSDQEDNLRVKFVQVLVMLFHSFLELLLFAYSLRLTLMEAQESCGRTWLIQAFVGAATSLETRSHSLFSQTLQFKAAFANPILSAWIMVRIIRILI